MSAPDGRDVLARLYNVAQDEQLPQLDDMAVRAGLLWRCAPCGNLNREDERQCPDCGAPRRKPLCGKHAAETDRWVHIKPETARALTTTGGRPAVEIMREQLTLIRTACEAGTHCADAPQP